MPATTHPSAHRPAPPRPAGWRAWAAPVVVGVVGLGGCVVVGLSEPGTTVLPPCGFKSLTGLDCPGCGLTRGVRQLAHGHVSAALDHNVLLAVAVPFFVYLYARWLAAAAGFEAPLPRAGRRWSTVVVAGLVAFTLLRNLPFPLGRYLNSTT